MSTAFFRRAAERYCAPAAAAAAAAAAGGGAVYLGQRGSANATARAITMTSSTASARIQTTAMTAIQRRGFSEKVVASEPTKAAASAAVKSEGGEGFLAWYESHLQSRPIPTKMVTGAFLWGLGDVVAQVVPAITHPNETPNGSFTFDYARLGRASTFGFALHAPIAHLHYNFLEWMTVRAGITGGVKVPVFKAFMEQFVYWSWFSNSLYHGAMGAMQGWTAQQCYDRIADVLWDTQKAQWAFWIPVQLVNFRYVPVRHQLNVVLLTSVVWTALLSAWYPPGEEEGERTEEKKER
eukprot:CAMPEP_0197446344 /NCGR_PEP_ID=MMETSP1175-20131217/11312_1 /TAXON_ID=1003142 /ORGANISM="Triceratium dubium, Strain CCMP147" /LENGTH=294 /DNA_ID=CAMNT_0042977441 /DNA_START=112 /DNA_END=999 /DNA_ORIENTATION=+